MTNINWTDDGDDNLEEPERVHEFPMGVDGPVLYIRHSQPHGMLEFATEKGSVPKKLEGRWTDREACIRAGQAYIDATVSPAKFNPKGEPAKVKDATGIKRTLSARTNTKEAKV